MKPTFNGIEKKCCIVPQTHYRAKKSSPCRMGTFECLCFLQIFTNSSMPIDAALFLPPSPTKIQQPWVAPFALGQRGQFGHDGHFVLPSTPIVDLACNVAVFYNCEIFCCIPSVCPSVHWRRPTKSVCFQESTWLQCSSANRKRKHCFFYPAAKFWVKLKRFGHQSSYHMSTIKTKG